MAVTDPCRSTLFMFVHLNHLSPEELGLAMRSSGPLSTSRFLHILIWHLLSLCGVCVFLHARHSTFLGFPLLQRYHLSLFLSIATHLFPHAFPTIDTWCPVLQSFPYSIFFRHPVSTTCSTSAPMSCRIQVQEFHRMGVQMLLWTMTLAWTRICVWILCRIVILIEMSHRLGGQMGMHKIRTPICVRVIVIIRGLSPWIP